MRSISSNACCMRSKKTRIFWHLWGLIIIPRCEKICSTYDEVDGAQQSFEYWIQIASLFKILPWFINLMEEILTGFPDKAWLSPLSVDFLTNYVYRKQSCQFRGCDFVVLTQNGPAWALFISTVESWYLSCKTKTLNLEPRGRPRLWTSRSGPLSENQNKY